MINIKAIHNCFYMATTILFVLFVVPHRRHAASAAWETVTGKSPVFLKSLFRPSIPLLVVGSPGARRKICPAWQLLSIWSSSKVVREGGGEGVAVMQRRKHGVIVQELLSNSFREKPQAYKPAPAHVSVWLHSNFSSRTPLLSPPFHPDQLTQAAAAASVGDRALLLKIPS